MDAPSEDATWTAFYANVFFPGPNPEDAYNPDFAFTTEVTHVPIAIIVNTQNAKSPSFDNIDPHVLI
jgi:hypothetical protein